MRSYIVYILAPHRDIGWKISFRRSFLNPLRSTFAHTTNYQHAIHIFIYERNRSNGKFKPCHSVASGFTPNNPSWMLNFHSAFHCNLWGFFLFISIQFVSIHFHLPHILDAKFSKLRQSEVLFTHWFHPIKPDFSLISYDFFVWFQLWFNHTGVNSPWVIPFPSLSLSLLFFVYYVDEQPDRIHEAISRWL